MRGRPQQFDRDEAAKKAVEVFWRNSYENTSVEDLVAATGINRFALYKEMDGKKGLYLRACANYEAFIREALVRPLVESVEPRAGLERFFSDLIGKLLDESLPEGCMMGNAMSEKIGREKTVAARIRHYFGLYEEAFGEVLKKVAAKGCSVERIDVAAACLLNTVMGLMNHVRLKSDRGRLMAVARQSVASALAQVAKE